MQMDVIFSEDNLDGNAGLREGITLLCNRILFEEFYRGTRVRNT